MSLKLAEITTKLADLNAISKVSWKLTKLNNADCIQRQFVMKNFECTCAFLTQVNMRLHLAAHHPTVEYTYNKVSILLQTHDVGGLSTLDFDMARRISKYAVKYEK